MREKRSCTLLDALVLSLATEGRLSALKAEVLALKEGIESKVVEKYWGSSNRVGGGITPAVLPHHRAIRELQIQGHADTDGDSSANALWCS